MRPHRKAAQARRWAGKLSGSISTRTVPGTTVVRCVIRARAREEIERGRGICAARGEARDVTNVTVIKVNQV